MAKLWQRSSGPKTKISVSEIHLDNFCITRPSVIFLSGLLTTDSKPQYIAEGIDEIESLLKAGDLSRTPEVYALSHKNLRSIFNIAAYNANPDTAYSQEAKRMAEALILPLVLDKNGKPLEAEDARRNLRNITFAAYSAGTVFAQEMFNASLKRMKAAGYREMDARDILGEVVLVSMAAVSRPTEEKERFTTLYLAASNDLAVRFKNRIWRPLKEFLALDCRDLKIRQLSQTSLLITTYIKKKTTEKAAGLFSRLFKITSNHEMTHYTTDDDAHNQFSRLVINALVNAVKRREKADVFRLLEPVTEKTDIEITAYRERIEKAMERGGTKRTDRPDAKSIYGQQVFRWGT